MLRNISQTNRNSLRQNMTILPRKIKKEIKKKVKMKSFRKSSEVSE